MGVLDISTRRVSLGNLGDVRAINTNTGALEAANRVADSVRRLNEVKIREAGAKYAGDIALGNGLAALGGGVAKFGGGTADFISKMIDEEDRRNEDAYANKFTAKLMAHNQGDGKGVLGAMNETIPEFDKGEWMKGNAEAADRFHKEVLKEMGLKDADFKDSRMQMWRDSFMVTQNAQWLGKRNAAMKAYADKAAEAKLGNDLEAVTASIVREGAWEDAAASMERVIERRGWDPKGELAKAFRREKGETVCGIGVKQMIDGAASDCAKVKNTKLLEGLVASFEKLDDESFIPPSSYVKDKDGNTRNTLKEWLKGADMKSLKRSAIKDAKDRLKSVSNEFEVKALKAEKDAVDADVDVFNKTVVAALDQNFIPSFSMADKLAELDNDKRLSPAARAKRMSAWGSWFEAREKDVADRRERNGYEMKLANGTSVWIGASRWGRTQADDYDNFTTEAIARDPVAAIADAESRKATGNIAKEDYEHVIVTATAMLNPKTVEVANKTLGGNFFTLVDTANPKKGTSSGSEFDDVLAYKYDPDARGGFNGTFQTRGFFGGTSPSSMSADMCQLDKKGERLFTAEEKTALYREIAWMSVRGYTQSEIDGCVSRIVAPKLERYYRMTMAERLADQTFIRSIRESVTSFDDSVASRVSAITNKNISKVKNTPEVK